MASIPSWPDRLPVPRIDGYAYQRSSPFIRSSMDSGLARQRRRFTTTPYTVSVVWRLTDDQLALFEAFVAYDLGEWSWFSTKVKSGTGVQAVKARFIDTASPYKLAAVSDSSDVSDVTATLEVVAMPVVSQVGYYAMRYGLASALVARAERFHRLIHITKPDDAA